jgi:hypothetical protein
MASYAVADSNVLKARERELYAELRKAKAKVREIEFALTDIQRGIVHEPSEDSWIPPFLRRNYDDPTG